MSRAGIVKLTLNTVSLGSTNFFIVGIIIAKQNSSSFYNKKDGTKRGVWTFTLRDSPTDYINVVAWGTTSYTEYLSSSFRTGDVEYARVFRFINLCLRTSLQNSEGKYVLFSTVNITNPAVNLRKPDDFQFNPPVTSIMEFALIEHISDIAIYNADDCIFYLRLLHLPTKPPGNFLSLCDLKTNGRLIEGQFVNLLVAVQKVGIVRYLSKEGQDGKAVMGIAVMDRTSTGFTVDLWDIEMIERAKNWKPRDTILFLADIKIKWNPYGSRLIGVVTKRSIVTENPDTKEAMALAQYASTAPLQPLAIVDTMAEFMPLPETIINVMTCETLSNQANRTECRETFTALVYAIVERFDIDGVNAIISSKCSLCKKIVTSICNDPTCTLKSDESAIVIDYDLKISIIDFTHLLPNCRLTGNNAENVIGCSSNDFHMLLPKEKVEIKWKYLFKPVAARLVVMPLTNDSSYISIVALDRISFAEFAERVPIH